MFASGCSRTVRDRMRVTVRLVVCERLVDSCSRTTFRSLLALHAPPLRPPCRSSEDRASGVREMGVGSAAARVRSAARRRLRPVSEDSSLRFSSRPWGIEVLHAYISEDKCWIYYGLTHGSMYLDIGFETLDFKISELKLRELTVVSWSVISAWQHALRRPTRVYRVTQGCLQLYTYISLSL